MVLTDNRVDIFKELVSIVKAGLTDIKRVESYPLQSTEIEDNKFPAVSLIEGGTRVIRELGSHLDIELDIFVRIFVKDDQDLSVGRNFSDQFISLIEGNPQLNDTCIKADALGGDPPIQWPVKNEIHIYDKIMTVRYRRDIT